MMKNVINSEVVVAYSHCPRKAFLLLFSGDKKEPHEYVRILEKQASFNRAKYLTALKQDNTCVSPYDPDNIENSGIFLVEAKLKAQSLEAYCDVLTKVKSNLSSGKHNYEPTIVVGTYSITKEQKIELAFVGQVLGHMQDRLPVAGTIIGAREQAHKVKLDSIYKKRRPIPKFERMDNNIALRTPSSRFEQALPILPISE